MKSSKSHQLSPNIFFNPEKEQCKRNLCKRQKKIHCKLKTKSHRIYWVGRDPSGWLSPTPGCVQDTPRISKDTKHQLFFKRLYSLVLLRNQYILFTRNHSHWFHICKIQRRIEIMGFTLDHFLKCGGLKD